MDLPGCTARGETRDIALSALPHAVREHLGWLALHGEAVDVAVDSLELTVVSETMGTGPFNPGDAAALFAGDLVPIAWDEMERFFCLLAYSRSDLLALVSHLPEDLLDRVPGSDAFSIRRILRHVGNAEEWYVSRIVPADVLPVAWKDDESLPILEFLDMERRTALEQIRGLDETQRSSVFHPVVWTDHPEEGWTARKVLRRFVEHEREHTRQIEALLASSGVPASLAPP
jgi:uncharacterized damage-inducible protein DinB/predicted RNase H-like HicB family nuclease